MPWVFDRLFKYDVTSVFKQLHLRPDSEYRFKMRLTAVNGTELDPHLLHAPSVSFLPGRGELSATDVFGANIKNFIAKCNIKLFLHDNFVLGFLFSCPPRLQK